MKENQYRLSLPSRMKYIVLPTLFTFLLLCSCHKDKTDSVQHVSMTSEMAYEGVNNYCHKEYDWSIAKENPDIMYVAMGDDMESEYKVVFRSYTGALVNFFVDKASGKTRIVEHVPTLNIENEVGTINLFDYLEKPAE